MAKNWDDIDWQVGDILSATTYNQHVMDGHFPSNQLLFQVDGGEPVFVDPQNNNEVVLRYDRSTGKWVISTLEVTGSIIDAAGIGHGEELADISDSQSSLEAEELLKGESKDITVPVPGGDTIVINGWGGYRMPEGDAPDGLEVQLVNPDGQVVHSNNSPWERYDTATVYATNSTGTQKGYKLRLVNRTGSDVTGTTTFSGQKVENFESTPLGDYNGTTAEWGISTNAINGSQSITTTVDFPEIYDPDRIPAPQLGDSFSFHVRSNVANTGNNHIAYFLFGVQDGANYYELRIGYSGEVMSLYKRVGNTAQWLGSSNTGLSTTNWHRIGVDWQDGTDGGTLGQFEISATDLGDGSSVDIWTVTDSELEYGHGGIGFNADVDTVNSGQVWFDHILNDRTVENEVGAKFDYEVTAIPQF